MGRVMTLRGSEFTQNRLDVTELANNAGAAFDRALSSVFAEKAFEQDFEDRQLEIALNQGQLNLNQINRIINDARVTSAIQEEQTAKSKENTSKMMFIALLDQLERDLERAIEGHRDYFRDKYGDDYATVLGRPILGDDMPDRLPGESDEDYNARVEDALFDKICNPDGSLKDEYKDHPDAERLGQWGRARALQRSLEPAQSVISDPDASMDEKLEAWDAVQEHGDLAQIFEVIQSSSDGDTIDNAAKATIDETVDGGLSAVDVSTPLSDF